MTEAQYILRLIVLGLFGATALLCLIALVKRPERRIWAFVALSLVVHIIAFYCVVLLGTPPLSPASLNVWSTTIRIHEGVLFLTSVWLFIWPARSKR